MSTQSFTCCSNCGGQSHQAVPMSHNRDDLIQLSFEVLVCFPVDPTLYLSRCVRVITIPPPHMTRSSKPVHALSNAAHTMCLHGYGLSDYTQCLDIAKYCSNTSHGYHLVYMTCRLKIGEWFVSVLHHTFQSFLWVATLYVKSCFAEGIRCFPPQWGTAD